MSYLKNYKVLLLIIAALILTNIGLLYFYKWKKPDRPHKSMKEQVMTTLEKEVGFSKEQLAVYDSMRTRHFDSMGHMFEELKAAKDSFFRLIQQPRQSDSVIGIYTTRINEKQQAIDTKMIRYFWSLKEISTEEQRPKMDSFIQSIIKRMSGVGGRRGPGSGREKK